MGIIDQQYESERPADRQAVERYRYLLRTAPPEDLERAHEDAFSRLSAAQRQLVLRALAKELPEAERARLVNEPRALARAATRAELKAPGTLERTLTPAGGGMYTNLFSSLAGAFIGSAIAQSLFGGLLGSFGGEHESSAANDDPSSPANDDTEQSGDYDDSSGYGGSDFDVDE